MLFELTFNFMTCLRHLSVSLSTYFFLKFLVRLHYKYMYAYIDWNMKFATSVIVNIQKSLLKLGMVQWLRALGALAEVPG